MSRLETTILTGFRCEKMTTALNSTPPARTVLAEAISGEPLNNGPARHAALSHSLRHRAGGLSDLHGLGPARGIV